MAKIINTIILIDIKIPNILEQDNKVCHSSSSDKWDHFNQRKNFIYST